MRIIISLIIILISCSIVFGAELTGDCVFREGNVCNQGEFSIGWSGGYFNSHFFDSYVNGAEYTICCPGIELVQDDSCSGIESVFSYDPDDIGGTHIELNNPLVHDVGYTTSLCLSNDGSNMECYVSETNCDNGAYCVVKTVGLMNTNLHITNCDDNVEGQKICCSITVGNRECSEEPETCNIDENCCDELYCSYGLITNPEEQGHCCEQGEYYNSMFGGCRDLSPCGYDIGRTCTINPGVNFENFITWATNEQCVNPGLRIACCSGVHYGQEVGNYFVPIIIYDGLP